MSFDKYSLSELTRQKYSHGCVTMAKIGAVPPSLRYTLNQGMSVRLAQNCLYVHANQEDAWIGSQTAEIAKNLHMKAIGATLELINWDATVEALERIIYSVLNNSDKTNWSLSSRAISQSHD